MLAPRSLPFYFVQNENPKITGRGLLWAQLLLFSHSEVSDSFGTSWTVALRGSSVLGIPKVRMLESPPNSWAEVSSLGTLERDWSWRQGL